MVTAVFSETCLYSLLAITPVNLSSKLGTAIAAITAQSGPVVERLEDRFEHLSLTLSRVKRELLLKAVSLQYPAELCDIKSPNPGLYSL